MDEKSINKITDISETLLIPLYSRAAESQTEKPILIDKKTVDITKELNKILKNSDSSLHQVLVNGKVRGKLGKKLNVTLCIRTRKFVSKSS